MHERTGFFPFAAGLAAAMLTGGCNKSREVVAPMPATTAPLGNVSDIDMTGHRKTALHQSPSLKGFDTGVVMTNGDVRRVGVLASQAQASKPIKIARAADATHSIHDELSIKK